MEAKTVNLASAIFKRFSSFSASPAADDDKITDVSNDATTTTTASDKDSADDNDEEKSVVDVVVAVTATADTPTTQSPTSETDDNSIGSAGGGDGGPGRPKFRPPPIHIPNSNFSDHNGTEETGNGGPKHRSDSTSPTNRKFLVKQSGVCEDSNGPNQPKADSPKFLIPPGKFDSTPR